MCRDLGLLSLGDSLAAAQRPPRSYNGRMAKTLTRNQIWLARGIALAADAVQIVFFPLFAGGAPEGADAVMDVCVAALLCWLCGFHAAFLPTFIGEALPTLDLFPSWTLAVLFVTRKGADAPKLDAARSDSTRGITD
jgi:hypothetical protein